MGRAFEYRKAAKLKRWGHMSRVFPKLGKLITIAAKEGGPDPDMNPKLRQAIQNAKAENMPKDNIDAAIKRATDKDAANLVEIVEIPEKRWYIGTQFHPEYSSTVLHPHPLFMSFIKACIDGTAEA